jgi:hypothetical protein
VKIDLTKQKIVTIALFTLLLGGALFPMAHAEEREELSFEMWTLDWDTISVDAGDVIEQMLRSG